MPLILTSRRRFLRNIAATSAFAVSSFATASADKAGKGADRKVRHASVGASGMGFADISSFAKHPAFDLVAIADVDLCTIARVQQMFPKVRVYQDWREMLKREKNRIDSVNVSTPDHMHAPIAMEAMRLGKHVYVQKPLTSTLAEARRLTEFARRRRLVTQMGIQTSSTVPQRLGEAMVQSGMIGKIREVHVFSNKSWGEEGNLPDGSDPVPPTLNWDAWVGVAEMRPYLRGKLHPGEWRRRKAFGTGTLGDMGCHIFSPSYRALGLTSPISIASHGPAPSRDNWAVRAKFRYVFPGTSLTEGKTVDYWWYDGTERPPAAILEQVGDRVPQQGNIFIGADGIIVLPHGPAPFALPADRFKDAKAPEIAPRDHYAEFLDAVLAGGSMRPSATFDYAGPLTETVLLGNVAAHFPGETLELDGARLRFPRKSDADALLTRKYRKPWRVRELT
jgi:predicted dehydrogenase